MLKEDCGAERTAPKSETLNTGNTVSFTPLQLALGVFRANDLRVISVNESHPRNAHVYYIKDGNMRVMSVPKQNALHGKAAMQLQEEVEILINRSPSEQQKVGKDDGRK